MRVCGIVFKNPCRYIFFSFFLLITFSISMYIMCVCLFSALSRRVGALQISIIIIIIIIITSDKVYVVVAGEVGGLRLVSKIKTERGGKNRALGSATVKYMQCGGLQVGGE